MTTRHLPIPDALVGQRADHALARMLGMSRTAVADIIDRGAVEHGGVAIAKSTRLGEGIVTVELPEVSRDVPEPSLDTPLEVIHHDADFVVVDKPVGVAAHPSPGWEGPTVVGALLAQGVMLPDTGVPERPGIVHRLDVGTSGLMVVATTATAYSHLKHAFKERVVDKTYHALVQGHPDPLSGTIDAPIARHPHHDYKFAVVAGGRDSVTHYEVLEMFRAVSLVEVRLETGRTHQIRVHMAALRHPLAGDLTYGADPTLAKRLGLGRQWLHAVRLSFEHPTTGARVEFESPYPADLSQALAAVREA